MEESKETCLAKKVLLATEDNEIVNYLVELVESELEKQRKLIKRLTKDVEKLENNVEQFFASYVPYRLQTNEQEVGAN